MPSRTPRRIRELLETHRRTGEPSPAEIYKESWALQGDAHGKAQGSFTEGVRLALNAWVSKKGGLIAFQYRLHRHKIISVTGKTPYLRHLPYWGKGNRGFVLEVEVLSIDGKLCRLFGRRQYFAWNRILGRNALLMLAELHKRLVSGGPQHQSKEQHNHNHDDS